MEEVAGLETLLQPSVSQPGPAASLLLKAPGTQAAFATAAEEANNCLTSARAGSFAAAAEQEATSLCDSRQPPGDGAAGATAPSPEPVWLGEVDGRSCSEPAQLQAPELEPDSYASSWLAATAACTAGQHAGVTVAATLSSGGSSTQMDVPAATHVIANAAPAAAAAGMASILDATAHGGSGATSSPALDAVMGMLQQLLSADGPADTQSTRPRSEAAPQPSAQSLAAAAEEPAQPTTLVLQQEPAALAAAGEQAAEQQVAAMQEPAAAGPSADMPAAEPAAALVPREAAAAGVAAAPTAEPAAAVALPAPVAQLIPLDGPAAAAEPAPAGASQAPVADLISLDEPAEAAATAVEELAVVASRSGSGGAAVALPGGGSSSGGSYLGGVEKLLALELEVVQLQQSLQIAQLEFETRTVQIHSLKQRADEAQQRAQEAEERAAALAQQVAQLERQSGDLRCQMSEAATRHLQDNTQLAARLSAACAKQQAAEATGARLRQQLASAQQAAEQEVTQLRRSASAQQGKLQERVAALQRENLQLRAHIAAACGALKAMGVPTNKVFSKGALALTLSGHSAAVQSPPESPSNGSLHAVGSLPSPPKAAEHATGGGAVQQRLQAQRHGSVGEDEEEDEEATARPAVLPVQVPRLRQLPPAVRPAPPQVPRLQLSSISLQQLQRQSSAEDLRGQHGPAARPAPPPLAFPTAVAALLPGPVPHSPSSAPSPALASPASAHSPVSSVQQSTQSDLPSPAKITARLGMSQAQQELLATARQWQLTARSAAAAAEAEVMGEPGCDQENAIPNYTPPLEAQPHLQQAQALPPWMLRQSGKQGGASKARPPHAAAASHGLPRLRTAAPLAALNSTSHGRPGSSKQSGGQAQPAHHYRPTYGQEPAFLEIKKAYRAVMASEADSAAKWARSVFSSNSAVETDPRRVEPVMQGLLQLCSDAGVPIPLQKCGACQYRLGSAKLAVRLVNGKLMARSGGGETIDIISWLEKQPVPQ